MLTIRICNNSPFRLQTSKTQDEGNKTLLTDICITYASYQLRRNRQITELIEEDKSTHSILCICRHLHSHTHCVSFSITSHSCGEMCEWRYKSFNYNPFVLTPFGLINVISLVFVGIWMKKLGFLYVWRD